MKGLRMTMRIICRGRRDMKETEPYVVPIVVSFYVNYEMF